MIKICGGCGIEVSIVCIFVGLKFVEMFSCFCSVEVLKFGGRVFV